MYTGGLGSYTLTLMVIFFLRKATRRSALDPPRNRQGAKARRKPRRRKDVDGMVECSDTTSATTRMSSLSPAMSPKTSSASPESPAQSKSPAQPPAPPLAHNIAAKAGVEKLSQLPPPVMVASESRPPLSLQPIDESKDVDPKGSTEEESTDEGKVHAGVGISSDDVMELPLSLSSLRLHKIKGDRKEEVAAGARSPTTSSVASCDSQGTASSAASWNSMASTSTNGGSGNRRRSSRQRRSCELSKLLIEFFYFFAHLDSTRWAISVQEDSVYCFQHDGQFPLVVEDAFQPGVNVAYGSFAFWHVQEAFLHAAQILSAPEASAATLFSLLHLLNPVS